MKYQVTKEISGQYLRTGIYVAEQGKRDTHFRNVATGGATYVPNWVVKQAVARGDLVAAS